MFRYDRRISIREREFHRPDGIHLGKDVNDRSISLPESALDGHMIITGKSGTGKSNLMRSLIHAVAAGTSSNIVLLDPHGELSDSVIGLGLPRRVMYLSPEKIEEGGVRRGITFNMVSCDSSDPGQVERTTGWLRDMFADESPSSGTSWGPRLEVVFRVILGQVIRQREIANLQDLVDIIGEPKELRRFLSVVEEPSIRKFLESQSRDWRNWTQYISSTFNRLLPIITGESTGSFISGRKDSVSLPDELMGKDTLISLNISRLSFPDESIRTISSLFLLKLWTSLMEAYGRKNEKIDTYIFIDEFQLIPSRIIEKFLREGRKFGMKVVLASQYLDTENRSLQHSVLGNTRNFVAFSMSRNDAHELSGMLPEKSLSARFRNTVMEQRLHHAVLISQGTNVISGPVSFVPELNRMVPDPHELADIKRRSILDLSSPLVKDKVMVKERTLHERIIDDLESFLSRNGVSIHRSVRIGGSVADCTFLLNGIEYVVEVEVSDSDRKGRVLEKLMRYPGRCIVLIAPEGKGGILHSYIVSPTSYREKEGLVMEIPTSEKGKNIYARDVAPSVLNTLIVEYKEGEFRAYWNNSTRRLTVSNLTGPGTFAREIDRDDGSQARRHILRMMLATERFALKRDEAKSGSRLGTEYLEASLGKICENGSEFVFLSDLFKSRGKK